MIKQHRAPREPTLNFFDLFNPSLVCTGDEEDRLQEGRWLSIEERVDPPPKAQRHTFEGTVQVNPLCKLGPKSAPGMTEVNGNITAILEGNHDSEEDNHSVPAVT